MNVESVGKTVEEALEAALKELNLTKEEVDYTVLVEPKKGFLGFGKKEAKILVTPKADTISLKAENKEEAAEYAKFLAKRMKEAKEKCHEQTAKSQRLSESFHF